MSHMMKHSNHSKGKTNLNLLYSTGYIRGKVYVVVWIPVWLKEMLNANNKTQWNEMEWDGIYNLSHSIHQQMCCVQY